MAAPQEFATGRRSGVVLAGLLLGTFVTGSAELLTAGLLPLISPAFGVSVAAAGSLFSAYALGLAIGGPLLAMATIRLDRRPVLLGSMALFAALVLASDAVGRARHRSVGTTREHHLDGLRPSQCRGLLSGWPTC